MHLKFRKQESLILFGSVFVGVQIFILKPQYHISDLRLIPIIAGLILSIALAPSYIRNAKLLPVISIAAFIASYAFYHFSNGRLFLLLPIPLFLSACLLFRRVKLLPSHLFIVFSLQAFLITYNDLRIRDRTLLLADTLYALLFILMLAYNRCVAMRYTRLRRLARSALVLIILASSGFVYIYNLVLFLLPIPVDICTVYARARSNPSLYELPSSADMSLLFRSCHAKILLPHSLDLVMPNLNYGDLASGSYSLSPHNPLLEYMKDSASPVLALLLFAFLSTYAFCVTYSLLVFLLSRPLRSSEFVAAVSLMYVLIASSTLFATYPLNLTRTSVFLLSLLLSASFISHYRFHPADS